jgi:hypothetical protein
MGQNLELPLARTLLPHSKEGLTIFQIDDIYRVGLVGKNMNYIPRPLAISLLEL